MQLALVTGAGGFIGSHLVERLIARGWRVRCLLRYGSSGSVGFLDEVLTRSPDQLEIRRGDIIDSDFVSKCCEGVDTIFHLAARISIPYSYEAPRDCFDVNVTGVLNILEGARRHGVRRVIHTSTSEVFGTAERVPMDETHPLKGQSPYSASKIAADKLVESYVCSFGAPAIVIRPFNTYGPRQSPRAVISTIIQQALTSDCVRLGALWPRRDFTFVADTVSGFVRAAEATGAEGAVCNLGTGHDISVGELATMILRILEVDRPIVAEDARERPAASEVGRLLSDNRRAAEILGWRPETSLEDGLRQTIDWWKANTGAFGWSGYAI